MKKILIAFSFVALLAACDNAENNNRSDSADTLNRDTIRSIDTSSSQNRSPDSTVQ
ncbi:MAG: membrane lipoprotein lipid attachment site-containing protein [Chitinophagaceae bacterium]|nr:membrane lipoprotein lipid attachment site-containing protein [Chitinophagaceae bacterium]